MRANVSDLRVSDKSQQKCWVSRVDPKDQENPQFLFEDECPTRLASGSDGGPRAWPMGSSGNNDASWCEQGGVVEVRFAM